MFPRLPLTSESEQAVVGGVADGLGDVFHTEALKQLPFDVLDRIDRIVDGIDNLLLAKSLKRHEEHLTLGVGRHTLCHLNDGWNVAVGVRHWGFHLVVGNKEVVNIRFHSTKLVKISDISAFLPFWVMQYRNFDDNFANKRTKTKAT